MIIKWLGLLQVAKLLLDHYMESKDPVSLKRLLEARDPSGMTALLVAVDQRDFNLIELLIPAGADLKAVDDKGDTALIRATTTPSQGFHPPKDCLSPTLLQVVNL